MTGPSGEWVEPELVEPEVGSLSNTPQVAEDFLVGVLDPSTGGLRLDRKGRIWEAVRTAQRLGATGVGRTVAVIDGGFDMSLTALGHDIHETSRVRDGNLAGTGRHGSVSALLVRDIAPEATLLLLDVLPSTTELFKSDVAAAVKAATAEGAAVVNLSLEFETTCPTQDMSFADQELLASLSPDIDAFTAEVERWMAHSEPYGAGRCPGSCRVCDALAAGDDDCLVVAASGNRKPNACPACWGRGIAVGFHSTETIERDGSVVTVSGLARTTDADVSRAELVVEEPPGFAGTSFAAPLLAGIGALLEAPAELSRMAWVERALTPVLNLGINLQRADDATITQGIDAFRRGLEVIGNALPERHQHWRGSTPAAPCPLCALLLVNWYDARISAELGARNVDRALAWGRLASSLLPESATTAANHGLAAYRSHHSAGDAAGARTLLEEAHEAYARAGALSGLASYTTSRDLIARELALP